MIGCVVDERGDEGSGRTIGLCTGSFEGSAHFCVKLFEPHEAE